MFKIILSCCLFLSLANLASAQSKYAILAEDAAGMWGQADGSGAGNDIVRAAFAAVGDQVVLSIVPYNRCKAHVLNGLAIACVGMSKSEDLNGKILFADVPLYTTVSTLFVRKSDAHKYTKLADIPSQTHVGTVLGYEYPSLVMQLFKDRNWIASDAPSEVHSLKKLAAGRFNLAVANLDALKNADYLLKQAGVSDQVQVAFEVEGSETFIGFARDDKKALLALAAFNRGMQIIKKNGTLDKILQQWKSKLATSSPSPTS